MIPLGEIVIIDAVITAFLSALNGLTIYHLLRFGSLTAITTRLVLYLHVSILIEIVGGAPMVSNGNDEICSYLGFLNDYGDLANVMGVALLTTVYYNFVVEKPNRNNFVRTYAFSIVFIFPLVITLLPMATSSYIASEYWCRLKWESSDGVMWENVQNAIFIATLISGTITFGFVLYHSRSEAIMSKRLLSTVGIYVFMSWAPWITALILLFIKLFTPVAESTFYPIYNSVKYLRSLAYVICFAYSYSLFMNYEMETDQTRSSSLPISFAAFEAAVSNIRYSEDAEDGNSSLSKSLLSRDNILDVSVNSQSDNNNELIKAYLAKPLRSDQNNNSDSDYTKLEQEDRTDDSTENPMISNGRIISSGSVLEVGRQSFDDDNRHN
jgi:hypothetical protein